MDEDEKAHLLALRAEYIKRRRVLELQLVKFGIYTPPHIQTEIDEIDLNMEWIDEQLSIFSAKRINKAQVKGRIGSYLKKEFLYFLIRIIEITGAITSFYAILFLGLFLPILVDETRYRGGELSAILIVIFEIIYIVILYKYRHSIDKKIRDYIFNKFG